jgi:hypothetical protein
MLWATQPPEQQTRLAMRPKAQSTPRPATKTPHFRNGGRAVRFRLGPVGIMLFCIIDSKVCPC